MLNENEIIRYSRQLALRSWNEQKQLKLRSLELVVSSEFAAAALYLAAAGIGGICLTDGDGYADDYEYARRLLARVSDLNPDCRLRQCSTADASARPNYISAAGPQQCLRDVCLVSAPRSEDAESHRH